MYVVLIFFISLARVTLILETMSKGNMFLGMASGKVADLVFYRMDGEQMTRSRNRHPRNPKTESQQYQRAIMATITAAYKSGREIFDHAFQGVQVGGKSQNYFKSENLKRLRSLIAAEVASGANPETAIGRSVAPGVNNPIGFQGMMISDGSYSQNLFTITPVDFSDGSPSEATFQLPAATSGETCAAYAARVGIISGDYYTVCGYLSQVDGEPLFTVDGSTDLTGDVYPTSFFFARMKVKDSFIASTDAVAAKTFGDIFEMEANSPFIDTSAFLALTFSTSCDASELVGQRLGEGTYYAWWGIIRSRKDSDLRSKSFLYQGAYNQLAGISSPYVLDAWMQGTPDLGDSERILEGGSF